MLPKAPATESSAKAALQDHSNALQHLGEEETPSFNGLFITL